MPLPQVTTLLPAGDATAIPSISPGAHRPTTFLHKSSTGSCTEEASVASGRARGWPRHRHPGPMPLPAEP